MAPSVCFLLENLWLIPVAFIISACLTYLWYAYDQYKWPFHKLRRW